MVIKFKNKNQWIENKFLKIFKNFVDLGVSYKFSLKSIFPLIFIGIQKDEVKKWECWINVEIAFRFYLPLILLFSVALPTIVPWMFWGESLWNSYFVAAIFRYCVTLHATWTVNSIAHMYGYRPYDKRINPRESLVVKKNLIQNFSNIAIKWNYFLDKHVHDWRRLVNQCFCIFYSLISIFFYHFCFPLQSKFI